MNVPSMPVSSSKAVITNPFARPANCCAAAPSASGKSRAVSATRLTERPSTPRW